MDKKWYQSKTKVGSVLIGGSMVLSAVGGFLEGSLDGNTAWAQLGVGFGVILAGIGLRNALG
jgi:hypothetical protein